MIRHIGSMESRVLVFGGPYSNLQALQRLQQTANKLGIPSEQVICTGDTVAYCADPEATVATIREWGIHVIAGNVELQLVEDQNDCGCNFVQGSLCDRLSEQWYGYVKRTVSTESINWMRELPRFLQFEMQGRKILIVHGSYHEVAQFIFQSTPWPIKEREIMDAGVDAIIAGHCGLPFFDRRQNHLWVNAGVIGMPANDGTPRVWYLRIDPEQNGLRFSTQALEYDYQRAAIEMQKKGLPQEYAETLVNGLWCSCDILPEVERQAQGKRLEAYSFIFPHLHQLISADQKLS